MKAMMLAAGMGTRLLPHTLHLPKPALPFLNVPLALYGLHLLSPLNIENLVVNTFHLPEKIEELFTQTLASWMPPVALSRETGFIRGSGGGVKFAEVLLADQADFILMNSDEVFFPEDPNFILKALQLHRERKVLATLITTHHHEVGTKFGGVWTTNDQKIMGFGKEKIPNSSQGHHFIGIQILSSRIFKYLAADKVSNILYDGLQTGIQQGESCWVYPSQGLWFETGNQNDFLDATRESLNLLTLKHLPTCRYLTEFIQKYSPQSQLTKTDKAFVFAHESAKWNSSQISGFAVLGGGAKLRDGVQVNSSVIGPQIEIKSDFNFSMRFT